eukprot:COSAG02_NODE_1340_length_13187_cov_6.960804_16_plen_53_part_00
MGELVWGFSMGVGAPFSRRSAVLEECTGKYRRLKEGEFQYKPPRNNAVICEC